MPISKVIQSGAQAIAGGLLGNRVHVVGVPGSGCPFSTVQAAVDAFEAYGPLVPPDRLVLVTPGVYPEDVTVHQDNIHFRGLGRPMIHSLTFTDCTRDSLAAFNASGDWHDLVAEIALYPFAERNEVRDIDFARLSGDPWNGLADASLRYLGRSDGGTKLGKRTHEVRDSHIYSTFSGGNCIALAQVYNVALHQCFVKGFIEAKQIGGLWFEECQVPGKVGLLRDTGEPQPYDLPYLGINGQGSHIEDLVLEGNAPLVGADYLRKCTFNTIHDQAKTAASIAEFRDCYVDRDIEISNLGPLIRFRAGRYMGSVIGAGAGGFTGTVGNNS